MSAFGRAYNEAERIPGQPIPIKPAMLPPGTYPIEALSTKLQGAARAICDKVQLPAAIAANSVLAVAALAVQPFIDIRLPTGEVIPASLFMISVAASGDRKSSADKLALWPVREQEREMHEQFMRGQSSYLADKAAYDAARKKAVSGQKNRDQIRREIESCGAEPIAPPLPMLVSDEGTLQGLQKLFADAMPSLGLFSDEGGQWLGGFAMSEEQRGQTGAALSKLWDGAPIKRVRGTDGVTILRGRRLSLHLMIQHRIARRLFGDPDLKDQGLLSRILISQPLSMKGDRAWKRPDENSDLELTKYQTRVFKMLSDPMPMDVETRELRPKVIDLSPEAEPLFVAFHDAVEIELKPGGGFEEITGFAAKLPEHAVRLAAVMAYFEDREVSSISPRALSAGIKLAKFYAEEALRVIGIGSSDEDTDNAAALIAWVREQGFAVVGKRYMSRNVTPKSIRPARTFGRALELLVDNGHLVEIKGGASMSVKGADIFCKEAFTVIADDGE